MACELKQNHSDQVVFKDIVNFVEKQVKILTDHIFGNILEIPPSGGRSSSRPKNKGNSFATTVSQMEKGKKALSLLW